MSPTKTLPPKVTSYGKLRFFNPGWIDIGSKYRWLDPNGKVKTRAYKHGPPKDLEIMSQEEFEKRYILGKIKLKPRRT
jgi:hypothetical protein